jgi:hypothetical protein
MPEAPGAGRAKLRCAGAFRVALAREVTPSNHSFDGMK